MIEASAAISRARARPARMARLERGLLLAAFAGGAGWGLVAACGPGAAAAPADDGLAQLLRFMALLKAAMAAGVVAAVWWRLSSPASPLRLLGYLASAAAMAAGPGLIWGMAHVGWGALLLHGGLAVAAVTLWRDPATAAKLAEIAARRRRALARAAERQRGAGKASTSPV